MRNLVLYCLLLATLLPTVSPLGVIAHYQLNREYIARVLCENRDRPELHCDGKCYLAKRLKDQQEKQDKETTERVQNTPSIQLFVESDICFTFTSLRGAIHSGRRLFAYFLLPYSAFLSPVFQPPALLV